MAKKDIIEETVETTAEEVVEAAQAAGEVTDSGDLSTMDFSAPIVEDDAATEAALAEEEEAARAEEEEAAAAAEAEASEAPAEEAAEQENAEPAAAGGEEQPAARPARTRSRSRAAEQEEQESEPERDYLIISRDGTLKAPTEQGINRDTMMELYNSAKISRNVATHENVLHGEIIGSKFYTGFGMCAMVAYGPFTVIIPESEMNGNEVRLGGLARRVFISNRIGATIDFMVPYTRGRVEAIHYDQLLAVASRREAMEINKRDFFSRQDRNGNYILSEGRTMEAVVTAVARAYMVLDVGGVECAVSARSLGVSSMYEETKYHCGDNVLVVIDKLEREFEPNHRTIKSVKLEVTLVNNEARERELAAKRYMEEGMYQGTVTGIYPYGIFVELPGGVSVRCALGSRAGTPRRGDTAKIRIEGKNGDQFWGTISQFF